MSFAKGTRLKLRFTESVTGSLSIEDLWDLPLPSLDLIAIDLNKKIEDNKDNKSFISKKTSNDTTLLLKFDIVKSVIEYKLNTIDTAEKRMASKARNESIMKAIKVQKDKELEGKSLQDLEAMLEEDSE